ncbi:MAG: TonB-dependent receptor [Bacteroidota bacterium]
MPIYEAAVANGQLFDYEDLLFGETGFLQTHRISVRGGDEKTSFFVGGTVKSEDGIVKNTGYDKQSVRMNLDHKATDWLDLSLSSNYIHSSTDRGFFNNDNSGTTMGISLIVTPPWAQLQPDENGNYPNNPYGAANFLQTRDLMTNNENVNRIVTGFTAKARIYTAEQSALRFILNSGIDHYDLTTTAIFPRELQFQKDGNGTNGASLQGTTVNTNTNISGFLVHNFYPGNGKLSFESQAGALWLGFDQNTILNTATELIGAQTNLDQSGSVAVQQTRTEQRDIGYYVQEEVNYGDQLIGTLGIRADKSSNNGDVNQLYYYPKASLAWNLHNSFGFTSDFLNQFKVRVAYGQSGNFANFGARFTTLNNTLIQGNAGSLIATLRGNSMVAPERQAELETGFDLLLLEGKVSFDFTVYRKTVTGLLLNAQTPGSAGFVSQVTNAADLQNQGIEIGLSVKAFDKDKFKWTSGANFWLNRSQVTRLDVEPFNVGAFGATLATFRIEEGKSATQIVGIGPADQDSDGDGLIVWGDAEPDFQISFPNTLSFSDFQLSFLIHWKQGGDNINLTTLLTDIFGTSPDYDDTTLDPTGTTSNGDFRLNALGTTADTWVEDASYVRLREIGLYYNVPRDRISSLTNNYISGIRVGLSAYNLINIFQYSSYDPEVSNFGANGISTGVEVLPFPSARRINFHLGFTF